MESPGAAGGTKQPVDAIGVEARLHAEGRRVRRAMLDELPDGEPHDWLYRLARTYPTRPGKALRPSLCLAACGAFGGARDALGVAVSIELLHNAFLIHDDIVDGSEQRRGRPTLPSEHGIGLALNAGDALAVIANRVLRGHLRGLPDELGDRIAGEFEVMALRTLEGQATELGWRRSPEHSVNVEAYLELIMRKTCWYTTIHPLRVGALLGSDGHADAEPMNRFGFHLGAAFQIRDDLLNLTGEPARYGKEINGDLFEGKRTLMLIHLTQHAVGPDRRTVRRYLSLERSERHPDLVAEIRAMMDHYGSIDMAQQTAEGIAGQAVESFGAAFEAATPGPDTDFVAGLVPYMLGRAL